MTSPQPQYFLISQDEWQALWESTSDEVYLKLLQNIPKRPASSAAVLDELGEMLNKKIAEMEILDSRHPSSFRKGIIMAYRDIEDWERKKAAERDRGGIPI